MTNSSCKKTKYAILSMFLLLCSSALQAEDAVSLGDDCKNAQDCNDVNRCKSAYEQKDYELAFPICSKLVNSSDDQIKFMLGYMYVKGLGTGQDYYKAFDLFKYVARHHYPDAWFNLANMYYFGRGTPVNEVMALRYYEMAAAEGNLTAAFNAGVIHSRQGNFIQAKKYLFQAVEEDNASVYLNIGNLYAESRFNNVDYIEAYAWYRLAADDPFVEQTALANLKEVRKYLNPKQTAEGDGRYRTYNHR